MDEEESLYCEVHGHFYRPMKYPPGWVMCRVCGNQVETGQSEDLNEDEEWD